MFIYPNLRKLSCLTPPSFIQNTKISMRNNHHCKSYNGYDDDDDDDYDDGNDDGVDDGQLHNPHPKKYLWSSQDDEIYVEGGSADADADADADGGDVTLLRGSNNRNRNNSSSMFDRIHQILYKEAYANANADTANTNSKSNNHTNHRNHRVPYNIDTWEKGKQGQDLRVNLDDADRSILGKIFYNATSVFEYGLGESTAIAAHVGVPRYSGTDANVNWVAHVQRNNANSAKNLNSTSTAKNFRYFFADVGGLLTDGNPKNAQLQKNEFDYQVAPLMLEPQAFDVYFIDGIGRYRYRVACACLAFLHALKYDKRGQVEDGYRTSKNAYEVKVGIHDVDVREGNDMLEDVAYVVEESKKLRVYSLRHNATENEIFQLWKKHSSIQDDEFQGIIRTGNSTSSTSSDDSSQLLNTTKFDIVSDFIYKRASAPSIHDRNRFDIINHAKKHPRGLSNQDRAILGHAYYEATSVFEFGLGESTDIAAQTGMPRYTGVASDPKHVISARNYTNSGTYHEKMDHFRFILVDAGKLGKDEKVIDKSLSKAEYEYQISPLLLEQESFDFYFIGGRYLPVSCLCISFLHAMKFGADMKRVKVGVNKMSQILRQYGKGVFRDVAEVIDGGEELWIFQLRQDATEEKLMQLWEHYRRSNAP